MSKFLKYLASFLFGLIVFIYFLKSLRAQEIQKAINFVLSFFGFCILLITICTVLVAILRRQYILKNFGFKLSFLAILKSWFINFSLSYFTPISVTGGEIPSVLFLEKKHNVSFVDGFSTIIVDEILNSTLTFISILLGFLSFSFYGYFPEKLVFYFIAFIVFGLLFLLLFFYFKMLKKESIVKWFIDKFGLEKKIPISQNNNYIFEIEKNIIHFFDIKKIAFWKSFLLSLLREILLVFRSGVLIFFLTGGMEIQKILIIYALVNLAYLFPVPASLGSLELTSWWGFSILGFSNATSLSYCMTQRFIDILFAVFGSVIFLIFIFDIIKT
ncbi:MAG: lysylphosphatidylglycerol synthase domain-containing protein [Minisyncoccia bacterium]